MNLVCSGFLVLGGGIGSRKCKKCNLIYNAKLSQVCWLLRGFYESIVDLRGTL